MDLLPASPPFPGLPVHVGASRAAASAISELQAQLTSARNDLSHLQTEHRALSREYAQYVDAHEGAARDDNEMRAEIKDMEGQMRDLRELMSLYSSTSNSERGESAQEVQRLREAALASEGRCVRAEDERKQMESKLLEAVEARCKAEEAASAERTRAAHAQHVLATQREKAEATHRELESKAAKAQAEADMQRANLAALRAEAAAQQELLLDQREKISALESAARAAAAAAREEAASATRAGETAATAAREEAASATRAAEAAATAAREEGAAAGARAEAARGEADDLRAALAVKGAEAASAHDAAARMERELLSERDARRLLSDRLRVHDETLRRLMGFNATLADMTGPDKLVDRLAKFHSSGPARPPPSSGMAFRPPASGASVGKKWGGGVKSGGGKRAGGPRGRSAGWMPGDAWGAGGTGLAASAAGAAGAMRTAGAAGAGVAGAGVDWRTLGGIDGKGKKKKLEGVVRSLATELEELDQTYNDLLRRAQTGGGGAVWRGKPLADAAGEIVDLHGEKFSKSRFHWDFYHFLL